MREFNDTRLDVRFKDAKVEFEANIRRRRKGGKVIRKKR